MAALAAAAVALSVAAVVVAFTSPFTDDRGLVALVHASLIATPVGVGLYALHRDPGSRFARLLVAAGFLWSPSLLAASGNSVLYSIGRIDIWLVELSVVVMAMAFPSGWLSGRAERWLAVAACAVVLVFYLPLVVLSQDYPSPGPWSACTRDCPANAFALTSTEPHVVDAVIEPVRESAAGLLYLGVALTLGLRIAAASRLMRRTLVPVLTGAIVVMVANSAFLVSRQIDRWSDTTATLGFIALLGVPMLVFGLFVGLLRWRLVASDALRQLVARFGGSASGFHMRDVIADAIRDPSLSIAYWAGEPGRWVDESGEPVALPDAESERSVTEIAGGGRPLAALVHDAAHVGEPAVREVAGGFALMALENQRLDAELRLSLRELQESRARMLHAVDEERQRIERDLHDGAQQRLVALRVALQLAAETAASNPRRTTEVLDKLGTDVEQILDEVRALARGVYPPLLADHGIGPALQAAADEGPLPTRVRYGGLGRYSQRIESAVYFCCLEALQNAAKHAEADSAVVALAESDELHFEVSDDGHGFEVPREGGAGLENMRDRIVALGGRLTIESAPGQGTRVSGAVPIGMARLTPDVELLFRRATEALDDSFAIIRALRDSNGAVIDFVVEHVNDAACRSTGRRREAQVGRTLGSMDPEYLRSGLFDWHLHALEAGGPSARDEVVYERTETGRRLREASEVRAAPVGAGRLAVSWHDITEHKRAERELSPRGEADNALELFELRFRAAVSGAPMVLFTMDRELRYTWVFNREASIRGNEAPLGKTDEEIFGRDVGRTLTPIYSEALRGQGVVREVDLDLPDGPASFELTVQPLRDEGGEVIGVAGAAYELALDGRDERPRGARRWRLPVRS